MQPPGPAPLRETPLSIVYTSHLPIEYLQAYPFAAFIVVHTPTLSDPPVPKLELAWTNDKISRVVVQRAVARSGGYDLAAWLDDPDECSTYTWWADKGGPLTMVKVSFPPHSTSELHHFYIITAISSHGVPELGKTPTRPILGRQFSSFPSQDGDQWQMLDVAPSHTSAGPVTDCATLLKATDWAMTALGPREKWCSALNTMVDVIMASPGQDCLWIGTNFNMIYNQHYAEIVDHPSMYGQSARVKEAWGPVWEDVRGLIDRCMLHGEACFRENDLLLYRKSPSGHYLEKYHTWSFVPIRDANDQVIGMYNPTQDTTAAVVASRRQATLRSLAQDLQRHDNVTEYFADLGQLLEGNAIDIPFALVYSCLDGSKNGTVQLRLETSVGIPDGHRSAPNHILPRLDRKQSTGNIRETIQRWQSSSPTPSLASTNPSSSHSIKIKRFARSDETTMWPLSQAIVGRQPVLLKDCSQLVEGLPIRAWDELPESAVILPIGDGVFADNPRGFVILGLNVRSLFDAEYEEWLLSLQSFLNASLNSTCAREIEQEVLLRNEKMEKAKTAWFQGTAHDLRSPLTLVTGPLDDVMRTSLNPSQRHLLGLANRNLARMQRLIDSLLDFSKLEAGHLVGHFVHIDLNAFVSELGEMFRPAVERRSISFEIELEPYNSTVLVDASLIEKAIMNLLNNALKFTNSGLIKIRVGYDTHVYIVVSDTGQGIDQSEIPQITNRFHRAASVASQGIEGSGIGLAIVKEITKLHDGELIVTSRSQEEHLTSHGSAFSLRIPLEGRRGTMDDLHPVAVGAYGRQTFQDAMVWRGTSDSGDNVVDAIGSVTTDDINRSEGLFVFDDSDTLLLVDDNDEMRTYIKRIFSPHCAVLEAKNGQEGLDVARRCRPQLILSDMMMPSMSGQELLENIREDQLICHTPVILLSAVIDDELRVAALTTGAEDFMLKPFKPRELLARVHLQMQIGKKRVHLESLYNQREREIALLSDHCPSGIMRTDADGNIVYANSAWRRYTSMPADEAADRWFSYVDPSTGVRLLALWNDFVYGDEMSTVINWRYLNGVAVTGTFIQLKKVHPEMSGILGCLQDVTYQEERLLDAERRKLEAEEAKRQQELLVDVTSHEMRTPVSAILQCSSVVRDNLVMLKRELEAAGPNGYRPNPELMDELDADLEALESIYQCGLIQERIAADILSLTRLELDMLSITETETDIRMEARKTVSLFASEAKMKGIEIKLDFGDLVDVRIATDHVRLCQVVTNLLANAIRFISYSSQRVITVRYEVSSEAPEEDWPETPVHVGTPSDLPLSGRVWLHVAVKDTGPGLKASEQAIVFERFVQGNKMIHSKYGGSGLGLYICRKIVERLDGKIAVKSQLGEGSEFLFYIGCRVHTAAVLGGQAILAKDLVNNGGSVILDAPGVDARSLLIVEDNLINSTVLKRQMIKAGWHCTVANDGQEALLRLQDNRYDIVLMDLEMPVMDGFTTIRRIRAAEPAGFRQRVIALTGNARQGQVDQALEAGMDDVLIKPYKLPDLLDRLRLALTKTA